jgi:uroporphyrinogen-III synthase
LIPFPIAPLKELTALVTRPAAQTATLCEAIRAQGGNALELPAIVIEPVPIQLITQHFDWLIFTSVNAVRHGLSSLTRSEQTRIAAIGKATAAALEEHDVRIDAMPEGSATSEKLLMHPAFATVQSQSVLLVKGVGGRELLHDELTQRGAKVQTAEVYRRACPIKDVAAVNTIESQWNDIDVVTLTSVETLDNLLSLLSDTGKSLLRKTPFVTPSARITAAAREKSLLGEGILSRGADDLALVGAIAAWHARAR